PSLSRNTETHNSFEKVLDRVGVDVFAVDGSAWQNELGVHVHWYLVAKSLQFGLIICITKNKPVS
ncbi:TPA: hypothetical protein ACF42V_001785, partial [Streptococcus pyogenes]